MIAWFLPAWGMWVVGVAAALLVIILLESSRRSGCA